MLVFCRGSSPAHGQPIHLSDGTGVAIGSLFERCSSPGDNVVSAFNSEQSAAINLSRGRTLVEQFWGRYVFFQVDDSARTMRVLRDPTGRMPCQFARYNGAYVFFSCAQDAADLGVLNFSINWPAISNQLISVLLEARETGLREVFNVLAGECLHIGASTFTGSFYWHPAHFIARDPLDDLESATRHLREVVAYCSQSWARRHESILVRLSGGLDSAIVLGSIQDMADRPQLTCLNFYSVGCDSDEREYARLAAARARCELVELERDPHIDLRGMLKSTLTAQPTHYPIRTELDCQEAGVIGVRGVTGIFDGNGGDGIFYQNPLIDIAADYVRRNGVRAALPRIALGIARTTNTSIWRVLKYAIQQGRADATWDPLPDAIAHASLVPDELKAEPAKIRRYLHPWFEQLRDVGPARLWHIANMSIPLNFEDQRAAESYPAEVLPIISQPVLELCLRIPTYLLAVNGWDRGAARLAFRRLLPSEIVRRQSKGGREEHVNAIFQRNIGFFREMLLEGRLAHEGLLNVRAAERALASVPAALGTNMMELFTYLSLETWVRNWEIGSRSAKNEPTDGHRRVAW